MQMLMTSPNYIPVTRRMHVGKELEQFESIDWYDNEARFYDPLLVRFTTPDPLALSYPSLSPYAYCANNPVCNVDLDGKAHFMHNGKIIGNDGIDDGKLFVLKTTEKYFRNSNEIIPGAGLPKKLEKATINFIKENNGNTEMFGTNPIAYENSIEIARQSIRQNMINAIGDDRSGDTADRNNREYGGYINDGIVFASAPGPIGSPDRPLSMVVSAPPNAPMFHSHPSGSVNDMKYPQPPSSADIKYAGDGANYCFGMRDGRVYIYDRAGVQAIVPLNDFVMPKIITK